MRRVLFVSYYTPPRVGVATLRTRQFDRYLPNYGWEVTLVTPLLDGAAPDVIQTDYVDVKATVKKLIGLGSTGGHDALGTVPVAAAARPTLAQRLVRFGYNVTSYPDPQVGWFAAGRKAVRTLLASGRFDAVLSSSPPFTTNVLLASISLNVPWVADFRDLWSESGYYCGVLNRLDGPLERWTQRRVSAITTVSDPLAEVLRRHRPSTPVHVVPNAFDPQEWEGIPFSTHPRCTFVYAGQLFGGRRDPRPLFRAIRSLLDENAIASSDLRVDFYSLSEPWLTEAIAALGLQDVVRVRGVVPRSDVMAAERSADRLLVFLWEGPHTEGILTGKLFEYLGARRPVLVLGGPDHSSIDPILASTGAGVRCADQREIAAEVLRAVHEHRTAVRVIDPHAARDYEAPTVAAKLARILDEAVG